MNLLRMAVRKAKRLWGGPRSRHALVGPEHLWLMKREFQARFLKSQGLQQDHYLLDLGCGTLRGGIPLITELDVGHYFGIEVRPEVLHEGELELKKAGLEWKEPTLLLPRDVPQKELDGKFDFVWAFSVLIHMTDEVLYEQLAFVRRVLKPTGRFFANVNVVEREEERWEGFPVVFRGWDFYRSAAARAGLAATKLGELRELGHVSGDAQSDAQWMLELVREDRAR